MYSILPYYRKYITAFTIYIRLESIISVLTIIVKCVKIVIATVKSISKGVNMRAYSDHGLCTNNTCKLIKGEIERKTGREGERYRESRDRERYRVEHFM